METAKIDPFLPPDGRYLYKYIRIYIKFSYGILNLLDKARGRGIRI